MTATLALADDEVGRFVEGSDGTRLFAREWGNPDGPAILFIHGWSQSSASWQAQTEGSLADEFRIVAYDWRGHGASDAIHDPAVHQDGGLIAERRRRGDRRLRPGGSRPGGLELRRDHHR